MHDAGHIYSISSPCFRGEIPFHAVICSYVCVQSVYFVSCVILFFPVCVFVVQVSYVKAVDIYLWTSFLFVFLSVIEYAAVNYCTTLEEMRKMKRGKVSTGGIIPAADTAGREPWE